MDEGEGGGVGDADNFFTLYLSVNNNRSGTSSSHDPSCLRPAVVDDSSLVVEQK